MSASRKRAWSSQFKMKNEEVMLRIKCDIHSWMTTYVGVVTNPYFAVSNDGGNFEIANVPAGTYTILTWHERYGPLMQSVRVRAGATTTVDFAYTGDEKPPGVIGSYLFGGVMVTCFASSSSTAFLSPGYQYSRWQFSQALSMSLPA